MNIQNIKNVLQENDKLCFECDSVAESLSASMHEVYTVNYADKTATVVSCFNQFGVPAIITTVYSGGKAAHFYNGLAEDDVIEMSAGEYNAMFESGGCLRPVNFSAVENGAAFNNFNSPNISYDAVSKTELKIGISDNISNVKMSVHVF